MAICVACGELTAEPPVASGDGAGAATAVVCPACGHREPIVRYPLYWVAGSPGAGKSTLVPLLRRTLPGYVVFEGEAIDFWRFEGAAPGDYSSLYNQWLKVAYEIAQNGCPVVFVATALPEQLDACTLRGRFAPLPYLGLVCAEEVQTRRLLERPVWRGAAAPEFIRGACAFTRRLEERARQDPAAVTLHDTTHRSPQDSAEAVAAWVRAHLPAMTCRRP